MHCAPRRLVGLSQCGESGSPKAFASSYVIRARASRLRTSPPSLTASGAVTRLVPTPMKLAADWDWRLLANSCWLMVDTLRSRANRVRERRLRSCFRRRVISRFHLFPRITHPTLPHSWTFATRIPGIAETNDSGLICFLLPCQECLMAAVISHMFGQGRIAGAPPQTGV